MSAAAGADNVLPSAVALDDFHTSGSRNTLRNILFSWPLDEVRAFFERDLGVPLVLEPTGKMFPVSQRPLDVVEALLRECARAGVALAGEARVTVIRRIGEAAVGDRSGSGTRFAIETADGRVLRSEKVVLATGGQSLPKTGSDGHGHLASVPPQMVAVLRPRAGRCRECGSRKSTPWVQVEPCDTDCTIGALARAIDAAMKETT